MRPAEYDFGPFGFGLWQHCPAGERTIKSMPGKVVSPAFFFIYLNGVAIGTVTENQVFGMSPRVSDYDSDGWTFVSSDSKTITWAEGIAASVLAAAIAAALGFLTGAAVLALIGANTLSIVAGTAVGAVVEASLYMLISGSYVAYQYVWTFEPDTGEVYGPYTTPLVL